MLPIVTDSDTQLLVVLCIVCYLYNLSAERATIAQRTSFHNTKRAL